MTIWVIFLSIQRVFLRKGPETEMPYLCFWWLVPSPHLYIQEVEGGDLDQIEVDIAQFCCPRLYPMVFHGTVGCLSLGIRQEPQPLPCSCTVHHAFVYALHSDSCSQRRREGWWTSHSAPVLALLSSVILNHPLCRWPGTLRTLLAGLCGLQALVDNVGRNKYRLGFFPQFSCFTLLKVNLNGRKWTDTLCCRVRVRLWPTWIKANEDSFSFHKHKHKLYHYSCILGKG